jgi:hypothetical protein
MLIGMRRPCLLRCAENSRSSRFKSQSRWELELGQFPVTNTTVVIRNYFAAGAAGASVAGLFPDSSGMVMLRGFFVVGAAVSGGGDSQPTMMENAVKARMYGAE